MRIDDLKEGDHLFTREFSGRITDEEVYVDGLDYDDNIVWVRSKLPDGTWSLPGDFDPADLATPEEREAARQSA